MLNLINKKELKKVKPFTNWDRRFINEINHETIKDELKRLEIELKYYMKYLGYDINNNEYINEIINKGKLNEILY